MSLLDKKLSALLPGSRVHYYRQEHKKDRYGGD